MRNFRAFSFKKNWKVFNVICMVSLKTSKLLKFYLNFDDIHPLLSFVTKLLYSSLKNVPKNKIHKIYFLLNRRRWSTQKRIFQAQRWHLWSCWMLEWALYTTLNYHDWQAICKQLYGISLSVSEKIWLIFLSFYWHIESFHSSFYNWYRQFKHRRETKDQKHMHMVSHHILAAACMNWIFFIPHLFVVVVGARLSSPRSRSISVIWRVSRNEYVNLEILFF